MFAEIEHCFGEHPALPADIRKIVDDPYAFGASPVRVAANRLPEVLRAREQLEIIARFVTTGKGQDALHALRVSAHHPVAHPVIAGLFAKVEDCFGQRPPVVPSGIRQTIDNPYDFGTSPVRTAAGELTQALRAPELA